MNNGTDIRQIEAQSQADRPDRIALRASYFTRVQNIGDRVASLVLQAETHRHVTWCQDPGAPHIISIGSIFAGVTRQSFVWGTGVMHPDFGIGTPDARRILAVRGKL